MKRWLGLIYSLVLTVWIIFFPDTEPLSQTLEKGGRTTIFNKSHPFYFYYCCLFLGVTLIQIWLIFFRNKK